MSSLLSCQVVSDDRASVQVHDNRHITYPIIAIASCRPDESIQHPCMYGVPSAGYPYTFYCKPLLWSTSF